ncbi:hypothetical protein ILUMI_18722 [Ignelater luminosus]|uniref:PiggyBac transposable element-derived protein domain-containing protein n=1 Tax=Ignelater luminosus TaxID=2038154 RepID=A0A8K0CNM8_IGNLU|nr:hypothetical protein ILUMI_18722 [Ignelater luminosus]
MKLFIILVQIIKPADARPFPKAGAWKTNRKSGLGKSRICTSSRERTRVEELEKSRKLKLKKLALERNLQLYRTNRLRGLCVEYSDYNDYEVKLLRHSKNEFHFPPVDASKLPKPTSIKEASRLGGFLKFNCPNVPHGYPELPYRGNWPYSTLCKTNHLNAKNLRKTNATFIETFWLTMSLEIFRFLLRYLRLDNKASKAERLKENKLATIRELHDNFFANWKNNYSLAKYTIDEKLEAFREINLYC